MRPLIVTEFVTLDGRMEAPGGEPTHPTPAGRSSSASPRCTRTSSRRCWRRSRCCSAASPTRSSSRPGRNATVLEGDVPAAVTELRKQDGGPILVAGSCTLVHTLLTHGLVDELRLLVFPVTIGSGLSVFPETPDRTAYTLTDLVRYSSGVLLQTYRPAR